MTALRRGRVPRSLPAKILESIEHDTNGGCWLYSGPLNPGGYGSVFIEKRAGRLIREPAHRLSYRLFRGEIPEGLQLDHLCRVRCCCNPAHLEPVTARENMLRSNSTAALNARKTHCKNGHEFTSENIYRVVGARVCKACARAKRLATGAVKGTFGFKTHCKRGHPLSGANLYHYEGTRKCRACWSVRRKERRREGREEAGLPPLPPIVDPLAVGRATSGSTGASSEGGAS